MDAEYRNFCNQAVAYLKPSTPTTRTLDLTQPDIPVIRDLGNGLLTTYVVIQGNKLRYVQQRHLVDAGLSQAQLHNHALENLTQLSKTKAAQLLWEDTLDHFAPNGFIAVFPYRDILAFCDAESAAGIEQLRQIVTRAGEDHHQITPVPYYRSGSTWRSYAD